MRKSSKFSFLFAFVSFLGFLVPVALNAADDVDFDSMPRTELIYRSEVNKSTDKMCEIFLSNFEFPQEKQKKSIPVFNLEVKDFKAVADIIMGDSTSLKYSKIKSLDCLKGLVRLVSSSKDVMFILSSPTQKLFVTVVNEKKVISSLYTNYWRFWALQLPIPVGFWVTPNNLGFKYSTVYKASNKKASVFSTDQHISRQLLEVLKAVLEPQKKWLSGSVLVGAVGIMVCLVAVMSFLPNSRV